MEFMLIQQEEVQFPAGKEVLSGRFVISDASDETPHLLFLHGAGRASKERSLPLALQLAEDYGISSFTFDFSGHGASTGSLSSSSLKKRVEEASVALSYAKFAEPISLCGFSMGGHVALELLKQKAVRALILFYPAVYAAEAVAIPFGDPKFSFTIRRPRSWESADIFGVLNQFKGNLLIVAGEKDEVIPKDVFQLLIQNSSQAANSRLIIVPQAPHLLLPVLYKTDGLFKEVCAAISQYVSTGVAHTNSKLNSMLAR